MEKKKVIQINWVILKCNRPVMYEFDRLEERYANGELATLCKELENALTRDDKSDIDAIELCNELRILARLLKNDEAKQIIDVLNMIAKSQMESILPNVVIAYRVLLTIPVSVSSGERTFSKLKLIKSPLRSTMKQNKLSNLAIISIEKETAKCLDYDDVITEFVNVKARKFGTF